MNALDIFEGAVMRNRQPLLAKEPASAIKPIKQDDQAAQNGAHVQTFPVATSENDNEPQKRGK